MADLEDDIPEEHTDINMLDMADGTQVPKSAFAAAAAEIEAEDDDPEETDNINERHNENLAENVPDDELGKIALDLIERVDADIESRKPWADRYRRGLLRLGMINPDGKDEEAIFDGAATVDFPMVLEAAVQSQSRAMAELMPPDGPCKKRILGTSTEDKEERGDRVAGYMNYQMMDEDPNTFSSYDNMLLHLALAGCCYRKVYWDSVEDRLTSTFLRHDELILPYTSCDGLADAPRYTHRYMLDAASVKKRVRRGVFRDYQFDASPIEEETDLQGVEDEQDGKEQNIPEGEERATFYEVYCSYDLSEWLGAQADDEAGETLPYIITIDTAAQTVVAIRRNWRPNDEMFRRRDRVVQYNYLPGIGSVGMGLIHAIGGLSDAATGTLRAMLDSAAFSNMNGGFMAKMGSREMEGDMVISPGIWKPTGLAPDELQKAFYTPPFRDPSPALFQLLGILDETGRRFASTTEAMVGDADNTGPVGTTVALIEQGSKVYTGIHKRLHNALGKELRIRFEINGEYIPEDGYPYFVEGEDREIYRDDFAPGVEIIPVSDPNIFSSTQRVAIAQAGYQLAKENPDVMDKEEALEELLRALKFPNIEGVLIKQKIEPMDPVTENSAILMGRPIKAFVGQDHQAHIQVHLDFMQHPQFGGHPDAQEMLGPIMQAHIMEHAAMLYRDHYKAAGVPLPALNEDQKKNEPLTEDIGPLADMIAAQAAQLGQQFQQMAGVPGGGDQGPSAEQMIAQAKIEQEAAAFAADEQRKQEAFERDQARKDQELQAKIQREDREAAAELRRKDAVDEVSDRKEVVEAAGRALAAGKGKPEKDSE